MDDPPSGSAKQLPRPPSPQSAPVRGSANYVFDVTNWHPKSVKRPRPVKSCTECRRRKLKCDRGCPCSQCQRSSYRVCTYGSGITAPTPNRTAPTASSAASSNEPSQQHDSDGSDGSDDEGESANGSMSGERPSKQRYLSRPSVDGSAGSRSPHQAESISGSSRNYYPVGYGHGHGHGQGHGHGPTPGPGSAGPLPSRVASYSHPAPQHNPAPTSSLSLLLNPPSPGASSSPRPPPVQHYPPNENAAPQPWYGHSLPPMQQGPIVPMMHHPPSVASAPSPAASPALAGLAGLSSMRQVSQTLENPDHLMSLNGDELREYTSALTQEFMARMERLEKMVLAKGTGNSSALTAIPPFPSSSTLSQLHQRYKAGDPRHQVIDASTTTMRALSIKGAQGVRTRYFGQNSTRVLLNLFDDAKSFVTDVAKHGAQHGTAQHGAAQHGTADDVLLQLERIYKALQDEHVLTMQPLAGYVDSMQPLARRMAVMIPRRDVCERLFQGYVNVSEGLYRVVHVPTFLQEVDRYWRYGTVGEHANDTQGVAPDFLPRYLCVLCIGSRFETESKGLSMAADRQDGVHIPTACALVRAWLDGMRGKPGADLQVLQTEMMLLHATRMISPRSHRLWTELGGISRLAMVMGLHRDPSEFAADGEAMSPFQGEVRRKLWYTIMDMDLHVSLASNLPSALRPGEYTCQPPRNLDDADIYPSMAALPPPKPMDQYTEGQMQRFAADTLPLRMRASDLLCHIDSLTDYGEVLAVGGELEKALDDINCLFPRNAALGSQGMYKEWRMRAMLDMHVRRPLLALYRPFALSAADACPPPSAISDIYLKSSMAMLTYMQEIDQTMPGFAEVSHMYYVILRSDIVQAAFSICHYIARAVEAEALPTPHAAARATSASAPRTRIPLIWTSSYMIHTVEHTVRSLALLVDDLSFDLRDVVALATVLGSVIPAATQAQRVGHIHAQIRRVLDTCIERLRGHASPGIRAALGPPGQPTERVRGRDARRDDSELWDAGFWDLWESQRPAKR